MKENNQKQSIVAKVLAVDTPKKRAMMLAALKTTFTVLTVVYSIITMACLFYLGKSYYDARKHAEYLKSEMILLQTKNINLENELKKSKEEIVILKDGLAKKENEIKKLTTTPTKTTTKKRTTTVAKTIDKVTIHKVETKNHNYNFSPYYYAMQETKFNRHFLSEKDMITVLDLSKKYKIDPNLVLGIIWVESRYIHNAKNKNSTASGYGQFIRSTGKWTYESLLKGKDKYNHKVHPFKPEVSIPMMYAYLDHLIKISKGDIKQVLIRYNGNELGKRYYEMIDDYFVSVSANTNLHIIEKNVKNNYRF